MGGVKAVRLFQGGHGKGLRLATFSCDVTPELGTPIYSSFKPLETIEHPLLAKGVIIESQGTRYVLCAVDWCELCNSTHDIFRKKIAQAAKTDPSYVAVQTVHQHTAFIADGDAARMLDAVQNPPPHASAAAYEAGAEPIAIAVGNALDTFTPFDRIGVGQAKVERVASNRRVPSGDGKILIRWSSCKDPELRAMPEGLIDPYLKTITFSRGDEPLARLHYYATHPQSFYGDPRASYDFPGIARERLQAKEDVLQIYFTGCSGNITAGKYNDGTPPVRDELANRLYAGMEVSVASTQYEPVDSLSWRTHSLFFKSRSDNGFTEAECRAALSDASKAPVHRFGAACFLAWLQRSHRPVEVSGLNLGDVYIIHLPRRAND